MFNSSEDNGDASVYEMMCTAGKWGTDGKWKEDKGKPVMTVFFPAYHYARLLFISDPWIFPPHWWAHHVELLPISWEMIVGKTACRTSSWHSSNSAVNTLYIRESFHHRCTERATRRGWRGGGGGSLRTTGGEWWIWHHHELRKSSGYCQSPTCTHASTWEHKGEGGQNPLHRSR